MLSGLAAGREVLFVGGKGGVGKTAVASALGLSLARAGRRVLLVSTDPAHNLGHLWDQRVGDEITELAPLLRGLEIDPARTTAQHLAAVRSTMERLMPDHLQGGVRRHLELARDAPGTHEAAVLERIAEVVEQRHPDELVVFDTAPSGHTARLVALPELMQAWTGGLMRRQERSARFGAALRGLQGQGRRDADAGDRAAADIVGSSRPVDQRGRRDAEIRQILDRRQARFTGLRSLLQDDARSSFVIVLAAERLPVLESVELHEQLTRAGMGVGALVVNKRSPADAGELLADRRAVEQRYVAQLGAALPDLPLHEVPLLPGDLVGEDALLRLASFL
ncbi:Arsenical pump-driving ATPase [Serinicoccus hydrothermalis]|uniref:Arsenical pump-driving ATPase n=1 Tax=Serinicoccus hydrothermalis TaxID=1758689 RepID=A0A1B1NCR1_9MICO|nr:ArsA family ATPase [Serinicoccus hydrothermalis]ANS79181.1 Arsenical pump-driving ATPase [Serinicoccus hydrothermalis]